MIISHKYKFIFVAIPKTATHAVRFAVRPYLGETDIEQVSLFTTKRAPFKEFEKVQHGHLTFSEIRSVVDPDIWSSYYKFAIVRNPFDRFISYCAFMNEGNPHFSANPQPYLYNTLFDKRAHRHILFKPQSHFLYDENQQLLADYIGFYENLNDSYRQICNYTGVPFKELEKINTSEHLHYQMYYNEEIKQLVGQHYQKDLQLFNYKF